MYLVAVRALENELKIQAEKVIHRAGGNFGTRVRSIAQRDLNIETRCVDVLHRPQARGAFAAAIYALQRQHEPSLRQLDINFRDEELVLPLKGEKRCGESAAGLRAMQDINTATLYVQDALCDATNTRRKIR